MSSVNRVILIGRVGQDPEIRATQQGKEIASFSLATSESWRDKNTGEKREGVEWHKIVCFSEGLVKVIKNYVKKGSQVAIEGQIKTRKWQDQSGQDKYITEIVLQGYSANLVLLGGKGEGQSVTPHNEAKADGFAPDLSDSIPF